MLSLCCGDFRSLALRDSLNSYLCETFAIKTVTYVLDEDGKIIVVENVPARVCVETGERFYSPETVERLQQMIWEQEEPVRILETPVYEFAT